MSAPESRRPPPGAATPRAVRAVSFDAAGTLFHPVRPVGELYATVAARHGVAIDAAVLHARFGDAFRDGNSNTLALAEAAEAVPWSKPADLVYEQNKPLPKIGGLYKDHVTLVRNPDYK